MADSCIVLRMGIFLCLRVDIPENNPLVYFSDHGEKLYDTEGELFFGRNEGAPYAKKKMIDFTSISHKQEVALN